ncbi:MAG: hypothetical protein RLP16_00980 [Alphaproteobacteria bacterium]
MAALPMGGAQACAVVVEVSPQVVARTPVVFRGTVETIAVGAHGAATLTFAVTETLRGPDAAQWTVFWAPESVIGAPEDLPAFHERYGDEVVVGLTPDEDGVASGVLAQEMCGKPFLDSIERLAQLLRGDGLID